MEKTITPEISNSVFRAIPLLVDFPTSRFWVDYDHEADVLYISFQHPQKATDTEMTDEGILFRYRGKQLVGITVLDASTRPLPESVNVRQKAAYRCSTVSSSRTLKLSKETPVKAEKRDSLNQTDLKPGFERQLLSGNV